MDGPDYETVDESIEAVGPLSRLESKTTIPVHRMGMIRGVVQQSSTTVTKSQKDAEMNGSVKREVEEKEGFRFQRVTSVGDADLG
jgi:hypothetical protein